MYIKNDILKSNRTYLDARKTMDYKYAKLGQPDKSYDNAIINN